jgi:hypothetical protein
MPIEIVEGASAVSNVADQPINCILYGGPGMEKTTDAVRMFTTQDGRCTAFFIGCEDGALKPIIARGMPVPAHTRAPVKTWQDMTEVLGWLHQNRGRFNGVIVDTISVFTMYVYKQLEEAFKDNKNKFLIPMTMRNILYYLREWTRHIGLHCVMIGHLAAPESHNNIFYKGGPLLAPRKMMEEYHGLIDTVLRVDRVAFTPGQPPTRVYWTGGERVPDGVSPLTIPLDYSYYRTKNREGCADLIVPADLGAFFRARRPPYQGI